MAANGRICKTAQGNHPCGCLLSLSPLFPDVSPRHAGERALKQILKGGFSRDPGEKRAVAANHGKTGKNYRDNC